MNNYKIIKSDIIDRQHTKLFTLKRQQIGIVFIEDKPVRAVITPGSIGDQGEFVPDIRQESLSVNIESENMKALIGILFQEFKELYETGE